MKRILVALCGMLFVLNTAVWSQASISFAKTTHDFGNIKEEVGSASCEFTFTNKGKSPLLIYKATSSCGCTTPLYSKEPIAPGAKSTIKVSYSTADRVGTFQKNITIYTNDPNTEVVNLIIRGSVLPSDEDATLSYPNNFQGLRLNRINVPILEAKIGSIRTEMIELRNTNTVPVNIRFNKVPKHIHLMVSSTRLLAGQSGTITIKYVAGEAKDYGRREDFFYLYTNEKDKTNINNRIFVSALITEDFSKLSSGQLQNAPSINFSDTRIGLGNMTRNATKQTTIQLTNKGKSNLIIHKIVPEYNGIKVGIAAKTIAPGKSATVSLSFFSGSFSGNIVQRVTFYTNDPKNSVSRIFLTSNVN